LNLPDKILVCEVGLRDGLQNEKKELSVDQKIDLLEQIQEAGVKVIEIGSFVNPKRVPQMADTDDVFKGIKKIEDVDYRALVLNKKGIERAVGSGVKKAKFTLSASKTHQHVNANSPREELFKQLFELSELAGKNGIKLSGAISTAFGCPFEGVIPINRIIEIVKEFINGGISEISLSDTTGMANPKQVFEACKEMQNQFPEIRWNLHFHNTRGMGLANVLAGMQAGVTGFDASIGGLGGCPFAPGATGNIATEDLLNMCNEMGVATGIDLDQIIATASTLSEWIGHDLPSSILKAGKNSDLHSNN